jgi:hypothetical protein
MSGVLERMVQRTRARLSSIEPLLKPRYAPQRSAGRRSSRLDMVDSLREVSQSSIAESGSTPPHSEALAPLQAANPRTISMSEPRISADRMAQRECFPTTQVVLQPSDARESGTDPLTGTQVDQQRFSSPNSGIEALPATEVDQQQPSSRNSGIEPLPATHAHQYRPGSRDPTAKPLSRTQVYQQHPNPHNPAAERSAQPAQDVTGGGDSAQQPVSGRLASTLHAASSARKTADSGSAKNSANDQIVRMKRARTESTISLPLENKSPSRQRQEFISHTDGPEQTRTDVTISIGHIEIRAAQPAEPPRRPGFRPRVSLSEFLNRRNREPL